MATFLHTRRFLSYHGDRFHDASLILRNEEGRIVGLLPAAIDPQDNRRVVSHPGITFGGLLHSGALFGERMIEAFEALKGYYRGQGLTSLRYKAVPYIYHQAPSGDDLYTLFRLGAERYRCDLSCAIDLDYRGPISQRRKRGLKKSIKQGIGVVEDPALIADMWRLLEENLVKKFNVRPVHSVAEITKLHSLFPQNIEFVVARLNPEVVGGVVLFNTSRVVHAQYTASSETGQEVGALDAVFEHCIERARVKGARYFDFGISTENDGLYLNDGLFQYKSEFGAGGVVHESYEINLDDKES